MISFPASITMANIRAFQKELSMSIFDTDSRGEIAFDFSELTEIDISGIQLIASLSKTLRDRDQKFLFLEIPTKIKHSFFLSGFGEFMGKGGIYSR